MCSSLTKKGSNDYYYTLLLNYPHSEDILAQKPLRPPICSMADTTTTHGNGMVEQYVLSDDQNVVCMIQKGVIKHIGTLYYILQSESNCVTIEALRTCMLPACSVLFITYQY